MNEMKKQTTSDIYKKLNHAFAAALLGQGKVSVTIVVYCLIAAMLLAYVSAQIYTNVLVEDVARLKRETTLQQETMNRLTTSYVASTSRNRVIRYCESSLGMVEVSEDCLQRFAIKYGDDGSMEELQFTRPTMPSGGRFGYSMRGVREVLRK
jgi:cell division protein FtsL